VGVRQHRAVIASTWRGRFALHLDLSTPALLFPAISLLLLAYTNRFLHLAALIRKLHSDFLAGHDPAAARAQIENLRARLRLIRWMQGWGVGSLLGCTLAMAALFFGWQPGGVALFAVSIVLMAISLALSLREIQISGGALAILLRQLENPAPEHVRDRK
jgi:hypothetical protein